MTIREFIEVHVPCLPESTVRAHLKAGRNSAHLMLTYSPNNDAARAKGRLTQRRQGLHAHASFGKGGKRFR